MQWALDNSKFEPEAENIRAAIAGYHSGAIEYSEHYTLLYAGQIVDTAPDYPSFVHNRRERLDQYREAHGEHWLWHEEPLKVHPDARTLATRSVGLVQTASHTALGHYYICQAFQKRTGWVSRMPELKDMHYPEQFHEKFRANDVGKVWAGMAGPRLTYRSLLDSGATFPSLYRSDFASLGISHDYYAAQSVANVRTANGTTYNRIYELVVNVVDDQGQQLVDPHDPVWPIYPKYLGGLCPVMESNYGEEFDPNGFEVNMRLSGMLAFMACYMSSTPTRCRLNLGEDRRDVLGFNRMPASRRWDISVGGLFQDKMQGPASLDNGKTTFTHLDGKWIEEDHPTIPHGNLITMHKGDPFNETFCIIDPWEECKVSLDKAKRQKQLDELKSISDRITQSRQIAASRTNPTLLNEDGDLRMEVEEGQGYLTFLDDPDALGSLRLNTPPLPGPHPPGLHRQEQYAQGQNPQFNNSEGSFPQNRDTQHVNPQLISPQGMSPQGMSPEGQFFPGQNLQGHNPQGQDIRTQGMGPQGQFMPGMNNQGSN